MNTDERKEKVEKIIKDTLHRVFGGSIPETTLNSLISEIDSVYKPFLAFGDPEEVSRQ